jgi:hypothetical protein
LPPFLIEDVDVRLLVGQAPATVAGQLEIAHGIVWPDELKSWQEITALYVCIFTIFILSSGGRREASFIPLARCHSHAS